MSALLEQKRAIRRECRARRDAIPHEARKEWDAELLSRLFSLPAYREAELLLLYYPVKGEPGLLPIAERGWADGKRIAFPISDDASCTMRFCTVSSLEELSPGAYAIPEPPEGAPRVTEAQLRRALCLVPGLAFDQQGFRIGYGKGYYDRFLLDFPGVSVGLVYSCLLLETLPAEPTDQAVAQIITEKEVRCCHAKRR